MEALKEAIYSLDNLNTVKDLVNRLTRAIIESADSNGLDILHHAILINYVEVVHYLLLRGFFTNPSGLSGPGLSHIHLSCSLGYTYIINVLLDARPSDYYATINRDVWLNWEWDQVEAVIDRRFDITENSMIKSSLILLRANMLNTGGAIDKFIPLDMAVFAGHINAVKLLLSTSHSKLQSKCMLESAVKLNSPRSLTLLLNTETYDQEQLDDAIKEALKRKEPECLKLLLKHGANILEVFHGLNAFHVMYMYSSAYTALNTPFKNVGIDECTSVLIDFKQNVNAKIPLGSYPLYSIIHSLVCEKDQDPSSIPEYHIKAFRTILQAGADTNFDEVEYSNSFPDDGHMLAFGRDLFTSGLNALFVSLQASDSWTPSMSPHLDECCLLLLKDGAQPNYIDSYGERPLHDLMKMWAMQHALGHMHVDLSNMLSILLRYGADPNLQSSNGLYPVHYYFMILFNLMGGLIAYERWKKSNAPKKILRLLGFMDTDEALTAYKQILASSVTPTEEGIPEGITEFLVEISKDIMRTPKSLQSICQFQIWESMDRKISCVDKLPLPNRHITELKNLFDVYCDEQY